MKWFKLHSEFADDPKLRTFTKCQRYDLICLMCLASESKERGVILLDDEDVAATLGQADEDYAAFIEKLSKKGIVERDENGHVRLRNWDIRQYDNPSDRPERVAERKAAMKERQRNDTGTITERQRNTLERDTDSETEAEKEKTALSERGAPAMQAELIHVPVETSQAPKKAARKASAKWSASSEPSEPVAMFHRRRIEAVGRAPTRREDEERQIAARWAEDESAFRSAIDGYFTCLGGTDTWPDQQRYTVSVFLTQYDRWAAGKPTMVKKDRNYGQKNGTAQDRAPGIVSKAQPNFKAYV